MRRARGASAREVASAAGRATSAIEQALDAIWGWFTGPLFQASIDLAAAARTDEELRASARAGRARGSARRRCCAAARCSPTAPRTAAATR